MRYFLALIPLLVAGCADAKLFRAPPAPLVTQIGYTTDALLGESAYRLGCADVLEVAFVDRPEWDCTASVGLDGRLPLGDAGSPVVEGATLATVRDAIATIAHRGCRMEGYPENSIPAFQHALASGANMIELDVRLTKDGKVCDGARTPAV